MSVIVVCDDSILHELQRVLAANNIDAVAYRSVGEAASAVASGKCTAVNVTQSIQDISARFAAFDRISDPVFVVDSKWKFLYANDAAGRACSCDHSELLGRTLWETHAHLLEGENSAPFIRAMAEHAPTNFDSHCERTGIVYQVNACPYQKGLIIGLSNITDRKRLEVELQRSDDMFRTIFDKAAVGMAIGAMDGTFHRANTAFERLMGYGPGELNGVHRDAISYPDDVPISSQPYRDLLANLIPSVGIEKRYVRKNREVIWVRLNVSVVRNPDNTPQFGVIVIEDITERKHAEEALRDAAQRLDTLIEHSPLGLIEWDKEGRITRWTSESTRLLGWTAEEVMGQLPTKLDTIHEDDVEGVIQMTERLYSGELSYGFSRNRNRRKDGSVIVCEWHNSALRDADGNTTGMLSLGLDVTPRITAEEEAANARAAAEMRAAELTSFISSMSDGVALFDTKGCIKFINQAGRKSLCIDDTLCPANFERKFSIATLDGTPMTIEQTATYRALQGETVRDLRYRMVTPDGRHIVISTSASPVRNANGEIIGATNVFRNITDVYTREEERKRLFQREHHIADVLQKALIPDTVYSIHGCEIAAAYLPAMKEAEVGGDFYDVFELDGGRIGILIGDVSGKGLAAAIRVAAARHSVRAYAYIDPSPASVLTLTNEALIRNPQIGSEMMTAFFAVVDTTGGSLTCANAGHSSPVIVRTDGSVLDVDIAGRAIGISMGYEYPEASQSLNDGDVFVLCTDGITEARSPSGVFFGTEGLRSVLSVVKDRDPKSVASFVVNSAKAHAGGLLRDDVAVLVFRLGK